VLEEAYTRYGFEIAQFEGHYSAGRDRTLDDPGPFGDKTAEIASDVDNSCGGPFRIFVCVSANGDVDRRFGIVVVRADGGLPVLLDLHRIGGTLLGLGEPGLMDIVPGKREVFPETFVDEAGVL
jgi:hypothetical protein